MSEVFSATIESNIPDVLAADLPALIAAARKVVGGRAKYLKNGIRREIVRAGLGQRLANAIRSSSRDLPDGVEARVWSKATVKRPGGIFDR